MSLGNPNLEERLKNHLREVVKHTGDEEAMNLLHELEHPVPVMRMGWHAEFLFRVLSGTNVPQYYSQEGVWENMEDMDPISLVLGGWAKRFYGPVPVAAQIELSTKDAEYVVYSLDLNPKS